MQAQKPLAPLLSETEALEKQADMLAQSLAEQADDNKDLLKAAKIISHILFNFEILRECCKNNIVYFSFFSSLNSLSKLQRFAGTNTHKSIDPKEKA